MKGGIVLSPNSMQSGVSFPESINVKMKKEMALLLNSPVVDLNVFHQHVGSNTFTYQDAKSNELNGVNGALVSTYARVMVPHVKTIAITHHHVSPVG